MHHTLAIHNLEKLTLCLDSTLVHNSPIFSLLNFFHSDKLCKCHTFKVEISGKNDTTLQEGVGYVGVNPSAVEGGACTSEAYL